MADKKISDGTLRPDTDLVYSDIVEVEKPGDATFYKGQLGSVRRERALTKATHGFAIGDALHYSGSAWVKADADASLICHAVCGQVPDVNTFVPVVSGIVHHPTHGLTLGKHWLSATAGGSSATAPTGSSFNQLIFIAFDTSSIYVDIGEPLFIKDAAGHLKVAPAIELTISGGVVTATQNYHTLDTQADAGADDLDTITIGGSLVTGSIIFLRLENVARAVTLKDGTGNLDLGADVVMNASHTTYALLYDGTNLRPLTFFSGGGSSSGRIMYVFDADSNQHPLTSPAGTDVINGRNFVAFDDTTDEFAEWFGVLPDWYAGGGITLTVIWRAKSDTTGSGIWEAAFESLVEDGLDTDGDAFAATNSGTEATSATLGDLQFTPITFTDGADMDSLVAGGAFRLRVNRDALDTLTGDTLIYAIVMAET